MKLNRICLLLVASLFTLFSSEQLAAQSSAPITAASAAPQDTIYAHPGRLVSTGDGARLNFNCMGAGSPAVVFESTFGDWSPAWVTVLPRIAAWTRACVYDHAGAGFKRSGTDAAHKRSPRERTASSTAQRRNRRTINPRGKRLRGRSGPHLRAIV
jgi:hypothetical protein